MIITDKSKLTRECKEVSLFEGEKILVRLEKELIKSPGIGLAANQIGIDAKVCIIRTPKQSINLINPVITYQIDKRLFMNEGCLSFPEERVTTSRFNEIVVKDLLHPAGTLGSGDCIISDDGWTVTTADKSLAVHWEVSVAITKDGPRILGNPDFLRD